MDYPHGQWHQKAVKRLPGSCKSAATIYTYSPLAFCSCLTPIEQCLLQPRRTVSISRRWWWVVVVRHGETSWNASRMIQGQMDPELNETGKQQAVMVARRLSKETKPAAVYSSDLKRAAETARTIATACDVCNVVLDKALRERHMGDLHGLKFDDAIRIKPEAYKAFSSDDRNQEIPGGGESLDQLSERCVSYLNAIAEKHKGKRVIVVTHGATVEEICRHADPTSTIRLRIPNTSISIIHISGVNGHWIPEKFGDVCHLNEDGFLQNAFGGDGASA